MENLEKDLNFKDINIDEISKKVNGKQVEDLKQSIEDFDDISQFI